MTDDFMWYELMAPDEDAAIGFYTHVVGWTASEAEQPDMRYTILSAAGQGVGGIMRLTDAMRAQGARPGWLGYVAVADTDAKAKEIAAAGGAILMPPGDIPNVGRFALVADPGGAPFYLLTPFPRDDAPPPLPMTTPGVCGWHELYAGQGQQAAFAFYAGRFGWTTVEEMDMGPMGTYRLFAAGVEPIGGMMDKPAEAPASFWQFYFVVDGGIDAAIGRIESGGGKVVNGPMEVPGGAWIVNAVDPQGAHFSLTAATR